MEIFHSVQKYLFPILSLSESNSLQRFDICKEDGMSSFRAFNVYQAVKLFGESSASPTDKKEVQETILEAP